ncbi:MAG: branched-chain amino acid ABC transporter permease [Anaerolineae bacterium]|uniref:branched-chain amino acid ABC transporter permease n=1 Tax=Candidatus Amarolinea dominans TaxID=3140696 RepID=UPI001D7F1B61|nr:branched-chain amino acid ABC transporter permease [Anaerolineae bacterium]MBK9095624.1 branched-chain amino acid ABC transporter permease [Anaerolineae bacterium]MBK9232868.1 branched-chain amino acid ABC transporter permease [Anaerolineae bacterium]
MESGIFHTTYQQDLTLRRTPAQKVRLGLFIAFVLIFPFFADNYYLTIANQIAIAAVGAVGLNILVGFTGQISLGQGAFMAVGAYTASFLTLRLGLPFWLTIPLAASVTAVVGAVFGVPSLRLKGLYLAIATLAAQQIIEWVITHWDAVTGGVEALVIPAPMLFGLALNTQFRFYWVSVTVAAITVLFTINLFRTRVGRAFVAIRDQDIAAEVMGVDIFRFKVLAFAVSSFFVGTAGALTAHYTTIISWERFTIETSILYLAMIIIGGLGSVSGSVYGAAFMTLLPAVISNLGRALGGVLPSLGQILPFIQQAIFGLTIILFLVFEPEGIAKLWRDVKDYFRLWPFSY